MRTETAAAITLRFDDASLYEAVRNYSHDERRSLNSTILVLIQDALEANGRLARKVRTPEGGAP